MLIHSGLSERVWFRFLLFEWYSRAWISNASMPLYTSTFMTNMRQTEFTAHGQNFHRNPPIHIVRKFHFTLVIFINTQDLLWHIEKKKNVGWCNYWGLSPCRNHRYIFAVYTNTHGATFMCGLCTFNTHFHSGRCDFRMRVANRTSDWISGPICVSLLFCCFAC